MRYIALLRGINVGGNSKVKMSDLKLGFERLGLEDVRTYINSGNVIFATVKMDSQILAKEIELEIEKTFHFHVDVVVIDEYKYRKMIENVPKGWGEAEGWKYNSLFLIPPYDIDEIMTDIGELKPDIEVVQTGDGVIYQALLFTSFGKTTSGKLASRDSYKKMTIRNWNTSKKLLELI
ncbi:MAG: DUF1697 domain-containing protein [Candidatus Saccharibacteria bacterium]|nr:DUF1697 domain-containing protein [Candidatus Saccharibacteria bacterium]